MVIRKSAKKLNYFNSLHTIHCRKSNIFSFFPVNARYGTTKNAPADFKNTFK